jgi:hypothetical protein
MLNFIESITLLKFLTAKKKLVIGTQFCCLHAVFFSFFFLLFVSILLFLGVGIIVLLYLERSCNFFRLVKIPLSYYLVLAHLLTVGKFSHKYCIFNTSCIFISYFSRIKLFCYTYTQNFF